MNSLDALDAIIRDASARGNFNFFQSFGSLSQLIPEMKAPTTPLPQSLTQQPQLPATPSTQDSFLQPNGVISNQQSQFEVRTTNQQQNVQQEFVPQTNAVVVAEENQQQTTSTSNEWFSIIPEEESAVLSHVKQDGTNILELCNRNNSFILNMQKPQSLEIFVHTQLSKTCQGEYRDSKGPVPPDLQSLLSLSMVAVPKTSTSKTERANSARNNPNSQTWMFRPWREVKDAVLNEMAKNLPHTLQKRNINSLQFEFKDRNGKKVCNTEIVFQSTLRRSIPDISTMHQHQQQPFASPSLKRQRDDDDDDDADTPTGKKPRSSSPQKPPQNPLHHQKQLTLTASNPLPQTTSTPHAISTLYRPNSTNNMHAPSYHPNQHNHHNQNAQQQQHQTTTTSSSQQQQQQQMSLSNANNSSSSISSNMLQPTNSSSDLRERFGQAQSATHSQSASSYSQQTPPNQLIQRGAAPNPSPQLVQHLTPISSPQTPAAQVELLRVVSALGSLPPEKFQKVGPVVCEVLSSLLRIIADS